jgi:hypothetical protein
MAALQPATTAGTIVFSSEAGEASDQKSPSRRPALAKLVAFGSTQANRSPGSVQVQVAG